jgi:hypothetical protein
VSLLASGRQENFELRRANEILKAASVFFEGEFDPRRPEVSAFVGQHRARFGGRADLPDPETGLFLVSCRRRSGP